MAIRGESTGVNCGQSTTRNCGDTSGCFDDVCPDFVIKRHDTRPPFRIAVEDCDGALDLTDENLILEMNMWANAKLKTAINDTINYFALADNIGFEQAMVGDIIVMDRVRLPEHMLVIAFDETNSLIQVQRGYNGTTSSAWRRGTPLRIFRAMNATAEIETTLEDVIQIDGTTVEDQVNATYLVHQWTANQTCLPGCYYLEFKLLKMEEGSLSMLATTDVSVVPSFTPSTFSAENFGCVLGTGIEWVRRFPTDSNAFLIKIVDSPTMEL